LTASNGSKWGRAVGPSNQRPVFGDHLESWALALLGTQEWAPGPGDLVKTNRTPAWAYDI